MGNYRDDEQLLRTLSEGDEIKWKAFYDDMRGSFRLFFMKYAGVEPEVATEIYHESMVIFHRNVVGKKLQPPLQSKLKTYLFGIGKLVYRKQGGQTRNWDDDIPDVPVEPEIEERAHREQQAVLVQKLLNKIGNPCRQLLELVYLKGYVMEAVAREMNIPSEGAARKRKFDCLQKMRAMMRDED
ncbi:MAG: hypothetical protein DHS20C18_08910 [Saprospiraceae bacterium]|nr:MAG: hypothetical protein DHS20C18_08910 [Saprospiraceae bacterium]